MSRFIPAALLISVFAVLLSVALPARPARAAPALVGLSQSCTSGKVNASFTWQGADANAKEQWIDLSIFDNGWQDGTFIGAGPVSASTTSYTWSGLIPGAAHVARINQKQADNTWLASATFPFSTIACTLGQDTPAVAAPASPTPAVATATSTPTTPSPTPSPVATATPVPAKFEMLGFANHTSNGGPPSDITPPDGTMTFCTPGNVYAFVRYSNIRVRTEYFVIWSVGGNAIPRANLILQAGSGTTIIDFPLDNAAKATYTLGLYTDKDKPALVEGSFTTSC